MTCHALLNCRSPLAFKGSIARTGAMQSAVQLAALVKTKFLSWFCHTVRTNMQKDRNKSNPDPKQITVRIFSYCSWLLLHYCMATCTRMTRTNRLSHVSIPFHMVAWKSMRFTLRPCGPSTGVCQQPRSRMVAELLALPQRLTFPPLLV